MAVAIHLLWRVKVLNLWFDTFKKLKDNLGDPGESKVWHHIVKQSQVGKWVNFAASEIKIS